MNNSVSTEKVQDAIKCGKELFDTIAENDRLLSWEYCNRIFINTEKIVI